MCLPQRRKGAKKTCRNVAALCAVAPLREKSSSYTYFRAKPLQGCLCSQDQVILQYQSIEAGAAKGIDRVLRREHDWLLYVE